MRVESSHSANFKMKFRRYNNNPRGRKTTDCVVRAISRAMDQSWEDTLTDLFKIALQDGLMLNDKVCYDKYLQANGWEKCKMPRHQDNTRYTVREFLTENPRGVFIINVAKHLTVGVDGELLDLWDCSGKSLGNYWRVAK